MSHSLPAPGTFCWVEIPSPDVEAAKRFYESVFGWKITPGAQENYYMFESGKGGLSGGLAPEKPASDGGTMLYITVEDIPAALQKITASGGKRLREKTAIGGDMGYFAHFADPNGNHMGIWSPR